MKIKIFLLLFMVMASTASAYDVFYVRTDGGTQEQCTGLSDAAYDGDGTGEACAWRNPLEGLGISNTISQEISGGDVMIIKNGDYRIGYDPDFYNPTRAYNKCATSGTWDCVAMNLPSATDYEVTSITNANPAVVTTGTFSHGYSNGVEIYLDFAVNTGGTLMEEVNGQWYTTANVTATTFELLGVDSTNFGVYENNGIVTIPTRIYGEEWDSGCSNRPHLIGIERAAQIFQMSSSDNVHLECLTLRDNEECFDLAGSIQCDRGSYPFGDWARDGIRVTQSRNFVAKNVDTIGFSTHGIKSGKQNHNERWENVKTIGNLYGWVGDYVGASASGQYNTGRRVFKNFHTWWTGCIANAEGTRIGNCCGQQAYAPCEGSDGWQSTPNEQASVDIIDSSFVMNVSDGLDAIYTSSGTIRISRSLFAGNAGNQLKTTGQTWVENSVVIGNCKSSWAGKDFNQSVDPCRSFGDTVELDVSDADQTGDSMIFNHNTVVGCEGTDCLIITDFYSTSDICDGTESIDVLNSVFYGDDYHGGGGLSNYKLVQEVGNCGGGDMSINSDYTIVYNTQDIGSVCPSGDMICDDPLLTTSPDITAIDNNPTITMSSDAYNPTTSGTVTFQYGNLDFNGNPPSGTRDWGALEYGSTGFDFTEFMTYIDPALIEVMFFTGNTSFSGGVNFTTGN